VPRAGITFSPELEWLFAAKWRGLSGEEFAALEGDEQSAIVAAYRTEAQMMAVISQEQAREVQRKSRKPKGRKR